MKKVITSLLFLLLLSASTPATSAASSFHDAIITEVLVGPNYGNIVIIKIDKPPVLSDCHTNKNYNYAFDGTTAQGKMYLSVVLTALSTQKPVDIAGYSDQCDNFNGIENLYHIVIK